ncbi:MAG: methylmalonyl Co-A mutase-associated GTPase MeaB [Planctomycetes bacterium]|nr:methylmalonyl Co-A mutase-associated GTPase MeaB [Planctomycetota bacterium]MBL7008020.1 methylmalonyl Co-A mutase-associated GTPase MeaB [Planctomycetota bacterium]
MGPADPALAELLARFRAGGVGALARAISWAEDGHPSVAALLEALHGETGNAWRTGITGPPGAGKSTLVDGLARHWVADGRCLGLLAVDPSSPFTGGALLGDRVRMDRSTGEGVFVRSMASRGSLGGLSLATGAAADLMDAFGFDELLLETVGVGQAEIDVAAAADTTVVVLTPASGDGIQAMKAGLMEAADLFVVNKADTAGAERLANELEMTLELRPSGAPRPPVLRCVARDDQGVAELAAAIEARREDDRASGRLDRRRQARDLARVRRVFSESLRARLWDGDGLQDRAREALAAGERPDSVALKLAARVLQRLQERAS